MRSPERYSIISYSTYLINVKADTILYRICPSAQTLQSNKKTNFFFKRTTEIHTTLEEKAHITVQVQTAILINCTYKADPNPDTHAHPARHRRGLRLSAEPLTLLSLGMRPGCRKTASGTVRKKCRVHVKDSPLCGR
jgi:hypothetical protein